MDVEISLKSGKGGVATTTWSHCFLKKNFSIYLHMPPFSRWIETSLSYVLMVTLVHAFFFTKDDAHKVKAHHHISPPPHPTSKGIQWRNCPRRCPRDPTRHGARAVKAQGLVDGGQS